MRKLMLFAAILAVAALPAAPALAQGFPFHNNRVFDNDVEQQAESGDFEANTNISLSGDNSNQCAPVLQFGNTGNNQNAFTLNQGFSPLFFNDFDDDHRFRDDFFVDRNGDGIEDFEVEDAGVISFAPEFANSCEQTVQQSAAAG